MKNKIKKLILFLKDKYTIDSRKIFFKNNNIIIKKSIPKRMYIFIIVLIILLLGFGYMSIGIVGNTFSYLLNLSIYFFVFILLIVFYYNLPLVKIDIFGNKIKTLFCTYYLDDIEKIIYRKNYDFKLLSMSGVYTYLSTKVQGFYVYIVINGKKINLVSVIGEDNTKKVIKKLEKILIK